MFFRGGVLPDSFFWFGFRFQEIWVVFLCFSGCGAVVASVGSGARLRGKAGFGLMK